MGVCQEFWNQDGAVDMHFNAGANDAVFSLAIQADTKILVAGSFTTLNGQPRQRLGRLHPDGTLDAGFEPSANADVHGLALQADGNILVAGRFTMLCGQTRLRIGRLDSDGTLDPSSARS